jgi:hypothetical protein
MKESQSNQLWQYLIKNQPTLYRIADLFFFFLNFLPKIILIILGLAIPIGIYVFKNM